MKQEGSLAHVKRLLGRRLCRLVIYAELHIFSSFCIFFLNFSCDFLEFRFQKKQVWNSAKHGLEDVSVVWFFKLAQYVHQNGSDGVIFHVSCECWI